MGYSLQHLAELVNGRVEGDPQIQVSGVAPVDQAQDGELCFVYTPKYAAQLDSTQAAAVIVNESLLDRSPVAAIVVENPRAAYARVVSLLYPQPEPRAGVHASAVIDDTANIAASASIGANVVIEAGAHIGENAQIGAGCYIGQNSRIGRGSHLYPNVSVYHECQIGEYCILHSTCVVGSDGFGFEAEQGQWLKIPQVGGVRIGNHVEIGACSVVDRGALQDTVIEDGVKLDNHVQIAHNVHVGAHTVMSRGVGIAGSTRIGKNCLFGGMTGVKDHIEIADNVIVTAMSLVSKSLTKAGSYSSNTPIDDTRSWRKNSARFRQLDEMARRIKQLEKQIEDKS